MADRDDVEALGLDRSPGVPPDPAVAPETEVGIVWGVGAVSRRLGIATPTLRTWDRRYGLGPSLRTAGGHRRYSEQDVARVAQMSQLIAEGVPSAHAARVAQRVSDGEVPVSDSNGVGAGAGDREVSMTVTDMMAAVEQLDAPTLSRMVSQVFDRSGVLAGWSSVVAPFLVTVGQRWEIGQLGIAAEHLASECITTELHRRVRQGRSQRELYAPVLLASSADEQHALPLSALAAVLSERCIGTRVLGARTPHEALAFAVEQASPRVVFLWSSLTSTGHLPNLVTVRGRDPELVVLLGGPGWQPTIDHTDSAAAVERVFSLDGAVERITGLVA